MVKLQQFFTKYRQPLVILMTIFIIIAEINHFILHWLLSYQIIMAIIGIAGLIPILLTAISSLQVHLVSIDVLVSLAVLGAFSIGEFNEAAIVTWLFLLGEVLENITLNKTRSAVQQLAKLAPQTAVVIDQNHQTHEEDVDFLEPGTKVLVKTGMQVPVDGQIISGKAVLNEASVTGEAKLVTKHAGDHVFAGTILENGTITILTTAVGDETTFGKIIELVEEAQDSQTKAQRLIDRFAKYYTPLVLLIAILIGLITRNFRLAITIMVLGCPGALVIGVPAATVAGIGNGAQRGLLFKNTTVMDNLLHADVIAFDKTGTLTLGQPQVAHLTVLTGDRQQIIDTAAAIEHQSSHPLAGALTSLAPATKLVPSQVNTIKGQGVQANVNGQQYYLGSYSLIKERLGQSLPKLTKVVDQFQKEGNSIVILAAADLRQLAVFGIRDLVRDEAAIALTKLKATGKRLVMLTGDNQQTAQQIASSLPLNEIHANMLPQDKSAYIKQVQATGKRVVFVGDGINDSPALSQADVGIAMGSGTDVAMDVADLIIVHSRLTDLVASFTLAHNTMQNMKENIAIALITVLLLFIGLFAGYIEMASGMLIHELSILIVILNSLRLVNFFTKHDHGQFFHQQKSVE